MQISVDGNAINREEVLELITSLADQALRCIAIGYIDLPSSTSKATLEVQHYIQTQKKLFENVIII